MGMAKVALSLLSCGVLTEVLQNDSLCNRKKKDNQ